MCVAKRSLTVIIQVTVTEITAELKYYQSRIHRQPFVIGDTEGLMSLHQHWSWNSMFSSLHISIMPYYKEMPRCRSRECPRTCTESLQDDGYENYKCVEKYACLPLRWRAKDKFIEKKKDQGTTSYAIMSTNTTSY